MAEILDEFPSFQGGGAGTSKYPWDLWLDGRVWKLTRGVDFYNEPKNFRCQVKNNARVRGKRTTTSVRGDDVIIQAVGRV